MAGLGIVSDTTFRISPKDLARELKARDPQTRKAMMAGIRLGAERGRTIVARATPVDTGAMKARWRVSGTTDPELVNDAPYAGVIEGGARPHGVSIEGRHAIKLWFMRKVGLTEREAAIRTEAFCNRLMQHGWPGTYFVRNSMPAIQAALAEAVAFVIDQDSKKRATGP